MLRRGRAQCCLFLSFGCTVASYSDSLGAVSGLLSWPGAAPEEGRPPNGAALRITAALNCTSAASSVACVFDRLYARSDRRDNWHRPSVSELSRERGTELTYGEIEFEGVQHLLRILEYLGPLESSDVLFDLGSGLGKTVLQLLLETPARSVIGIEFVDSRAQVGMEMLDSLYAALSPNPDIHLSPATIPGNGQSTRAMAFGNEERELVFEVGDFLQRDLSNATIVYTCSNSFPDGLLRDLSAHLAASLAVGTIIVSLRKLPYPHPQLTYLHQLTSVHVTWAPHKGRASIYVVVAPPPRPDVSQVARAEFSALAAVAPRSSSTPVEAVVAMQRDADGDAGMMIDEEEQPARVASVDFRRSNLRAARVGDAIVAVDGVPVANFTEYKRLAHGAQSFNLTLRRTPKQARMEELVLVDALLDKWGATAATARKRLEVAAGLFVKSAARRCRQEPLALEQEGFEAFWLGTTKHRDSGLRALEEAFTSAFRDLRADPGLCGSGLQFARDLQGRTFLHQAARHGNGGLVHDLVAGLAADARDFDGRAPAHDAIDATGLRPGAEALEALLQAGAQPNAADFAGNTPLHVPYMMESCAGQVEALLRHGADANQCNQQRQTPLHQCPSPEVAGVLLEHRADPNAVDGEGSAALHRCIGRTDLMEKLLDAGARVDVSDNAGDTPLHRCCAQGSGGGGGDTSAVVDGIGLLLRSGAAAEKENHEHRTPLFSCVTNVEALRLLLQARAPADTADSKGTTPLHEAVRIRDASLAALSLLLEARASPEQEDADGRAPLALSKGDKRALLLQRTGSEL